MSRRATAITARIAAVKRRLLKGGMLRSVEWMQRSGDRDLRGRQDFSTTLLDALIQTRPGLDRGLARATDRSDNIMVYVFDPVAITDSHLFRWGEPPHIYRIKQVDGLLKDEENGVRFFSSITLIR